MRVVTDFLVRTRVIENLWIPMSDGCRLAARIILPEDAEAEPVPAILEYIPYRKRDYTAVQDAAVHAYFAGHGYACVRVDMRGSGESDGILMDEYLPQEQEDGVAAIAWIADQPWCSGSVGMMGYSWGGITSMQIASRRPPALKAIIPVTSSVDRYYDDAAYFMGCYIGQTIGWGAEMDSLNSRPPDPEIVGDAWCDMWLERLEKTPFFLEIWLRHQRRDALWLQGAICEDYGAIQCPVLATGGWADCWPNTVGRLLANLKVPRKGISGPWGHNYCCFAKPGPRIGFLQEALRWWDRWLKDADNGVEDDPLFRGYILHSAAPQPFGKDRPGHWIAEDDWPPTSTRIETFHLGAGQLTAEAGAGDTRSIRSPQSCGLASGEYMPWFVGGDSAELPADQREDDGKSLLFDTEPLAAPLQILGTPRLALRVASDCSCGLVAARLCDVAPDGASTLITFGILNLAQRAGREGPLAVEPGRDYDVSVRLNDTGYELAPGHRLRLALSTNYWPMAWPVPHAATLTVTGDASALALPVRQASSEDRGYEPFGPPESAAMRPTTTLEPGAPPRRKIAYDRESGSCTYEVFHDASWIGPGVIRIDDIGTELRSLVTQTYSIDDGDPLSATADYRFVHNIERGDWRVRTESHTHLTCDCDSFRLTRTLEAYEGEERVFSRVWDEHIPRDGL
ncbi:MAG: CocE/NonD family hydrolase [bacterium]|nr:CocE/NonD family hydrolase [bacterium]